MQNHRSLSCDLPDYHLLVILRPWQSTWANHYISCTSTRVEQLSSNLSVYLPGWLNTGKMSRFKNVTLPHLRVGTCIGRRGHRYSSHSHPRNSRLRINGETRQSRQSGYCGP